MTTAISTQPLTARIFLFGGTQNSAAALARALEEQGVLGSLGGAVKTLSQVGREAAGGQLVTVAHGMLELDLGDLIVGGWRKYADLTAVAKRTITRPDSTEVVELATHCITSTHRPLVELLVDDVHLVTVSFELCIEFVVRGLVATVRHGHLVAFRSGSCDVTATLAAEGRQLVTRQAQLQLPMVIRLGDGVPLLLDAVRPLARG